MRKTGNSLSHSPFRVAIYCRISRDKQGGGLGVERQEADCRALAERIGWEVVAVYVDNDISAYSGKRRPDYERLVKDVERGEVHGLIVWHTDRLIRRLIELERWIALAESPGLQIRTVTAGDIDLTTASGRMNARILASVAQKEVEQTRERIRDQKRQAAEAGKYRGGPRPFGYYKGGMKVNEKEAEVIRDMTAKLLAGRSLRSLVEELNQRRVPTPQRGGRWSNRTLKQVIVRPRNAALISQGPADRHGMQIIGKAAWPAILDEETFYAVRDLLMQPSRRTSYSTEVRHLGSGLYVCGRSGCGHVMRPGPLKRRRNDPADAPTRFQYRCTEGLHLTITEEPTDAHVRAVVAEVLRDPRVVAALGASKNEETAEVLQADRERRAVLAARLERTDEDYDNDLIDARRHKTKTAKIAAEIAEVDARLADGVRQSAASPILAAPDPGQAFLDAPIDVQRAVLAAVVRVEILPSGPGVKWSTSRIRITPALEGQEAQTSLDQLAG